jgi:hypothetical protein
MTCRHTAAIHQTLTRSHAWTYEPFRTPITASHKPGGLPLPKRVGAQYNTQRSTTAEQSSPLTQRLQSCHAETASIVGEQESVSVPVRGTNGISPIAGWIISPASNQLYAVLPATGCVVLMILAAQWSRSNP